MNKAVLAQAFLEQGIRAKSAGQRQQALALLKQAAGADLTRPEPWYWMGEIYEAALDRRGAAWCYYLADEIGYYPPALEALSRMGYLWKPVGARFRA
jgi:tetratricopeptide (TPR) repeat protein